MKIWVKNGDMKNQILLRCDYIFIFIMLSCLMLDVSVDRDCYKALE